MDISKASADSANDLMTNKNNRIVGTVAVCTMVLCTLRSNRNNMLSDGKYEPEIYNSILKELQKSVVIDLHYGLGLYHRLNPVIKPIRLVKDNDIVKQVAGDEVTDTDNIFEKTNDVLFSQGGIFTFTIEMISTLVQEKMNAS